MNYKKVIKWQYYNSYKNKEIKKYYNILMIIYNVKIYYIFLINGYNYHQDMILKYNKYKIMIG